MSTRSNIRPRPVDVNKQLVIYKDASELELDTADVQAAEMASQARTHRCCLHDTKLSSQQHALLSLSHGVPHTVAGPHRDPRCLPRLASPRARCLAVPAIQGHGHGGSHGHGGGNGNNNAKKPKAIPIPDMREVETHYRDYLPLFTASLTYLHGKGGTGGVSAKVPRALQKRRQGGAARTQQPSSCAACSSLAPGIDACAAAESMRVQPRRWCPLRPYVTLLLARHPVGADTLVCVLLHVRTQAWVVRVSLTLWNMTWTMRTRTGCARTTWGATSCTTCCLKRCCGS